MRLCISKWFFVVQITYIIFLKNHTQNYTLNARLYGFITILSFYKYNICFILIVDFLHLKNYNRDMNQLMTYSSVVLKETAIPTFHLKKEKKLLSGNIS